MMIIELTKEKTAIVSDSDYAELSRHSWHWSDFGYAVRRVKTGGRERVISMHRQIMGFPNGLVIDHINGDSLDNRRENLRVATNAENRRNTKRHADNKLGVKGVSPARGGRFRAQICVDSKVIHLGHFLKIEDAAAAYAEAARRLHGTFARIA